MSGISISITGSGLAPLILTETGYTLQLTPNNQGLVFKGGSAVYKHTLRNQGLDLIGTQQGEIELSVLDSEAGFNTSLYYDANNNDVLDFADIYVDTNDFHTLMTNGAIGLDAGEAITLFTKVQASVGVLANSMNTTTLAVIVVGIDAIEYSWQVEDITYVANPNINNSTPIANNDQATTSINQFVTVDVVNNDEDPDGDKLLLTQATVSPSIGQVIINANNTLTFTPNQDFVGKAEIQYVIADTTIEYAQATLTVDVNQAPTPQQDSASVYEYGETTIDVLWNDSDPEGDNLTVISAMANNGSAYVTEFNTINYTASFAGIDTITYTVQDVFGNTAQSFVIVDVLGDTGGGGDGGWVNNAPIANNDYVTTDELTLVTVDVVANDYDHDGGLCCTNQF